MIENNKFFTGVKLKFVMQILNLKSKFSYYILLFFYEYFLRGY
jgi:hypothetical protein